MKKGSITPFCALAMMLVSMLLFTLLELARFYGLERYTTLKAEAGIDSVCAEYQPLLWQEYGLLFLDGAYGTETFTMDYVSESLRTQVEMSCKREEGLAGMLGLDLFPIKLGRVTLEEFALATDAGGELFLNYVAERMKEKLPLGMAENLYKEYRQEKELEWKYEGAHAAALEAQELLRELKQGKEDYQDETDDEAEDAFWVALQIQNSNIFQMVLDDNTKVSPKVCKIKPLREREKKEGILHVENNNGWYRKLLVLAYMDEYFSNFRDKKEGHYLDYEMEYVLCGKSTEWENLENTLRRILLIREAGNVCYLLQDEEKMQTAEFLANLLGLLAEGNPIAVSVFQTGIIGAWACLESVLDVRALVSGERIPFVKNRDEWTTDVGNILASFRANAKARICQRGMFYEDYLKQQLFFIEDETLAYRMMEVMELSMREHVNYENCRMNQMLVALKYCLEFESKPIFSSLIAVGTECPEVFYFKKEVERSYIP